MFIVGKQRRARLKMEGRAIRVSSVCRTQLITVLYLLIDYPVTIFVPLLLRSWRAKNEVLPKLTVSRIFAGFCEMMKINVLRGIRKFEKQNWR